jgi:GDPmannose 4,6-dehydratase
VSKAFAHYATVNYREAFGLYCAAGILFNHESPLRGHEFVTRKITMGLAAIQRGRRTPVELGNLESRRDWGFAGDYVRGMWMMLQQPVADDYILATGQNHSVRDFVDLAAQVAGFRVAWEGEGEAARAVDRATGRALVTVSPEFYRPAEVDFLIGDASKARDTLGWRPEVSFPQLVTAMMEADLRRGGG